MTLWKPPNLPRNLPSPLQQRAFERIRAKFLSANTWELERTYTSRAKKKAPSLFWGHDRSTQRKHTAMLSHPVLSKPGGRSSLVSSRSQIRYLCKRNPFVAKWLSLLSVTCDSSWMTQHGLCRSTELSLSPYYRPLWTQYIDQGIFLQRCDREIKKCWAKVGRIQDNESRKVCVNVKYVIF